MHNMYGWNTSTPTVGVTQGLKTKTNNTKNLMNSACLDSVRGRVDTGRMEEGEGGREADAVDTVILITNHNSEANLEAYTHHT